MGHKKRNLTPRPNQLPTSAVAVAAIAPSDAVESHSSGIPAGALKSCLGSRRGAKIEPSDSAAEASSSSVIKVECEKALTSFRRGSYNKAIRLMKESCARHQGSALIHRVQGTLCVKVASVYEDPATKQRFLRNAIDSARKAVELSPNSIEFAHFYANLLYEAANDGKEYEEVVQECHRALSIENPIDPAKESLQDESQQKILTPEARITHVQDELRSLIQKSNIASLSTWMKTLSNGEEKFRLIPIRRIAEDPMESRLIQTRRPNEIKKATKTPEERRKEIEVRVAAARLLQQKSESSSLQEERNGNNKGSDLTLGAAQRGGERRKHGNSRKNRSTAERRDWVSSYWNSMNNEMKRDLLRVKVSDVKAHFSSYKDGHANEIITEALAFFESNKTWRFWVCCRCSEKFTDAESHMQHVVHEHLGNELPKMQAVLPQSIDNEWIHMLLNCSWKPLDLSAAVKMLGDQPKRQNSELYECSSRNMMDDNEDCFQDACGSSPGKENLGDTYNFETRDSCDCDESSKVGVNGSEGDQVSFSFPPSDRWPLSEDPECAKLLEKVHAAFELLIRHKYLAASHLNKVIQFTLDELRNLVPNSQVLNRGLDQSPICICLLGAPQLWKILKFLQDLSQSCGLSRYSEKSMSNDDVNCGDQCCELTKEILLDGEGSYILLDEKLLETECTQDNYMGSVSGNVATGSSGRTSKGNNVSVADGFLSYIFMGPSSGEHIASWMRTKDEKTSQGLEIMQILEKEFCHLQTLCERKCEHLSYEEALQTVEDLCLEEGRRREASAGFNYGSYDSVLRKRREELIESDQELVFISSRFELDALTNVLKEAESLNGSQFEYEDLYGNVSSELRDLELGEADEWRMKDSLNQADTSIEIAIHKQKEHLSAELSKIDARMMHNVTRMQQLELKLGPVSSNDYQTVLMPLVKSYMRAHLEALAEKDATEKSDAAREALLVELALDSKKDVKGKNDNSRHVQEKSKDKKKNKDSRKAKDLQATVVGEHHVNHDSVEHRSCPVASYDDHSEAEGVSRAVDALKEQKEEYIHKIELEKEDRKLEETLEYQRQIENEAKKKHLAEQQKKYKSVVSLKDAETAYDVSGNTVSDDLNVLEQGKSITQENWIQKNGLLNNLEGPTVNTIGILQPINSSVVYDAGKLQQGKSKSVMANGTATQADGLQSNQRTGRRGRRHKVSHKLVDGKYQVIPPGKENGESWKPRTGSNEGRSESILSDGDAGTKTLRQLQVEEDEEEKFQADLKKAVSQSLDTYQAQRKLPSSVRTPERKALKLNNYGRQPRVNVAETRDSTRIDVFGTGLQNKVGEYNCFLNVIIQSLWHLRQFRAEFLGRSTLEHHHVGDPCVVCALYEIFIALNVASTETREEPVAPTSLRIALSKLYPNSSFFQEGQMNDASEVLAVIFDCLHGSLAPVSNVSDTESSESNCIGSWDCANHTCIVHSLFGLDIFEQMNCFSCGLESRHMKYTSFFHNINANALRAMKVTYAESSFDELLNFVEMNHQLACDPEVGGCGKSNHIHHILSTPPQVFTTVIGWQKTRETVEDIAATLAALSTQIDISIMYRGLDPKNTYMLVSVVCYYGQHYSCFAYSHDYNRWVMYDDKTVKVIGNWEDVLSSCERGRLQPQVLFYEKR